MALTDFEFEFEQVSLFHHVKLGWNPRFEVEAARTLSQLKGGVQSIIKTMLEIHGSYDQYEDVEQPVVQQINTLFDTYDQGAKEEAPGKQRGPYKRYTSEMKQQAIQMLKDNYSYWDVCQRFGVPKKNLKRWLVHGTERKKGGGRKRMDMHLEDELFKWCLDEGRRLCRPVTRSMIKQKALLLSAHPDKFKASKGWTDKFVKKYNLRKRVVKELQSIGLYRRARPVDLKQETSATEEVFESPCRLLFDDTQTFI